MVTMTWENMIAFLEVYAEALIQIASDFRRNEYDEGIDFAWTMCNHCGEDMEHGCGELCAGAVARRALGLA